MHQSVDYKELEKAYDVPVGTEIGSESPQSPEPPSTPTAPTDDFVMIEERDMKKLLVDQLKKELKKEVCPPEV